MIFGLVPKSEALEATGNLICERGFFGTCLYIWIYFPKYYDVCQKLWSLSNWDSYLKSSCSWQKLDFQITLSAELVCANLTFTTLFHTSRERSRFYCFILGNYCSTWPSLLWFVEKISFLLFNEKTSLEDQGAANFVNRKV